MFQSIAKAVSKRFGKAKKPAQRESPLVSPCPEENCSSTSENAAILAGSRSEAENAVLAGELNQIRTPENSFIAELSRCAGGGHEVSAPELHCNGASGSASIPDGSQSEPGNEIRQRAYLKWEASGKPKGNDSRFWLAAKKELFESQSVADDEIRRRAYLKWEAAGKPKGGDSRFWLAAKEEVLEGK